jgi:2-oxo-4-hydroxy-4-carboxy-5-ureidoimidazoline decarboxylase
VSDAEASFARMNTMPQQAARQALSTCCGATRWVDAMLQQRPFASPAAMLDAAERIWSGLQARDYLEAFSHHPKIGADEAELARKFGGTAALSRAEQGSVAVAVPSTLQALRDSNIEYERRHGFIFIVCASGKSADEMLTLLSARLHNPTPVELQSAAAEQAKITKLRLQRWAV